MPASVPVWIPPLLLALVWLGVRQSRPRTVKPGALLATAVAMCVLSLYGVVSAFGPAPAAWSCWIVGYVASVVLGATCLMPRGLATSGSAVRMPGSWVPLMLLLGIFAAKFALGLAAAVHSSLLQQTGVGAAMGGLLGALSGGFGGRALAVQRAALRGPNNPTGQERLASR